MQDKRYGQARTRNEQLAVILDIQWSFSLMRPMNFCGTFYRRAFGVNGIAAVNRVLQEHEERATVANFQRHGNTERVPVNKIASAIKESLFRAFERRTRQDPASSNVFGATSDSSRRAWVDGSVEDAMKMDPDLFKALSVTSISHHTAERYLSQWLEANNLRAILLWQAGHNFCPKCKDAREELDRTNRALVEAEQAQASSAEGALPEAAATLPPGLGRPTRGERRRRRRRHKRNREPPCPAGCVPGGLLLFSARGFFGGCLLAVPFFPGSSGACLCSLLRLVWFYI